MWSACAAPQGVAGPDEAHGAPKPRDDRTNSAEAHGGLELGDCLYTLRGLGPRRILQMTHLRCKA